MRTCTSAGRLSVCTVAAPISTKTACTVTLNPHMSVNCALAACLETGSAEAIGFSSVDGHGVFADPDLGARSMLEADEVDATRSDHDVFEPLVRWPLVSESWNSVRRQDIPSRRQVREVVANPLLLLQRGVLGTLTTAAQPFAR